MCCASAAISFAPWPLWERRQHRVRRACYVIELTIAKHLHRSRDGEYELDAGVEALRLGTLPGRRPRWPGSTSSRQDPALRCASDCSTARRTPVAVVSVVSDMAVQGCILDCAASGSARMCLSGGPPSTGDDTSPPTRRLWTPEVGWSVEERDGQRNSPVPCTVGAMSGNGV